MNQNDVKTDQKCSILQHISLLFEDAAVDNLTSTESDIAEILQNHGYLTRKRVSVENPGDHLSYFFDVYETT